MLKERRKRIMKSIPRMMHGKKHTVARFKGKSKPTDKLAWLRKSIRSK